MSVLSDEWSTEFPTGCALDEGTAELSPLPIDFAEAIDCLIGQVGRAAFELYAACALGVLETKVTCYAEHQGSGEFHCAQDFNACPNSEDIAATRNVCSPFSTSHRNALAASRAAEGQVAVMSRERGPRPDVPAAVRFDPSP